MSTVSTEESPEAADRKQTEFWDAEARRVLQTEMLKADVDVGELARRLAALGYPPASEKALAMRIARGTFTFGFALMALQALGVRSNIDVSYVKTSDRLPERRSA